MAITVVLACADALHAEESLTTPLAPVVATPYPSTQAADQPAPQPIPAPERVAMTLPPPNLPTPAPVLQGPEVVAPPVEPVDAVQPTVQSPPEEVAVGEIETEAIEAGDEAIVSDEAGPAWYTPAYWFGPTPWDSGFELGLNGASGTSESLSFRTGGFIKRKTDDYKLNTSLYYNKTNSEGVEVQSNALLDARYDWLFNDSPWTLFVMSQTFYDEFQAFDINFSASTGIGYQWLDEDWAKFTTSFGSGASREFGAPMEEWVQEANFGMNFEQQVDNNKKFYAKVDYFPEWGDFSRYRVLADMGLEIELVSPSNVSLKFSATDRFDSHPDGVDPHNLNYSALLIWKL